MFFSRYTAGDFTGQILQQCLDLIRYQPPATNLTVPSTMQGDHLTPGPNIEAHREFMMKRKHVSHFPLHFLRQWCKKSFTKSMMHNYTLSGLKLNSDYVISVSNTY